MTTLRLIVEDDIATLTLDGAGQRNILDEEFWSGLGPVLDELEAARGLRVIVLRAAGDAFSAGGDIGRMRESLDAIEAGTFERTERDRMDRNAALQLRWSALPAIKVAAVQGPAVGAGLSLALSCDHRIMAHTAFLDSGFSRMGLPGDVGATYYLPRLIGPHRAQSWLLRARRVPAGEALALGLVDESVPAAEIDAATAEAASAFAALSPEATALVLDRASSTAALRIALDAERDATIAAKQTAFHRRVVLDFVARATAHRSDRQAKKVP